MRGFRFVTTLVLEFRETERDDRTKFSTFHSSSKTEMIIIQSGIDNVFESIYSTIIKITRIFGKRFSLHH